METGKEEYLLLQLLGEGLTEKEPAESCAVAAMDEKVKKTMDWNRLETVARRHSVLSLLCYPCMGTEELPEQLRKAVAQEARGIVLQSYRLLFATRAAVRQLEGAGIPVAVLKGVAAARSYPEPELRKAGDIDLLVHPEHLEAACRELEKIGCRVAERQPALHHVVLVTEEGIETEIHTMLAEPFDNEQINEYLKEKLPECLEHRVRREVMGVELPMLDYGCHAFELLLHMLQHFLRSGFGLRFLCDWVVLWREEVSEKERRRYLELVRESRVKGFSDMVTKACCQYLGLEKERVDWMGLPMQLRAEGFMREVLEAEEFGKSSKERMVVLRKPGLVGYVWEFQHQMHLNFPRAGKWFPLWPVLWVVTLIRFLRNNRKIRGVSGRTILRKASERSRVMEQMKLWK
ncbi:MAG: nucleotidyltransferase family protein [Firmicutes bacterium]|nr:nucleotidyltransferase family protein [Bacillota bacterium]